MLISRRSAIASSACPEAREQEETQDGDDRVYRSRQHGSADGGQSRQGRASGERFRYRRGESRCLGGERRPGRSDGGRGRRGGRDGDHDAAGRDRGAFGLPRGRRGALLIDCSTIDVETARAVARAAADARFDMLDAPVSGGVIGAETASLTFMVGGGAEGFERGRPVLAAMGRTIVHAGPAGNGQAAKICNNMILGASMIAVCEAFSLAERLGLEPQTLFEISAKSSGQCWALTSYCPVPGPVPGSPANRDYAPGFTAAMMLKDLRLAQQAAGASAVATPLGAAAANLFQLFVDEGAGGLDFSAIYRFIRKPEVKI